MKEHRSVIWAPNFLVGYRCQPLEVEPDGYMSCFQGRYIGPPGCDERPMFQQLCDLEVNAGWYIHTRQTAYSRGTVDS